MALSSKVTKVDVEPSKKEEEDPFTAGAMKDRFIKSLRSYVRESLTEMLEDFVQSGSGIEGRSIRDDILTHIVHLPIAFDDQTRRLFTTTVMDLIQREIRNSLGRCMELFIGLIKALNQQASLMSLSTSLLSRFGKRLNFIYFENDDPIPTLCGHRGKNDSKMKEAMAYTKLFVKIVRFKIIWNNNPVLMTLNKIVTETPNAFHARIMFYLLQELSLVLMNDAKQNSEFGRTLDFILERVPAFYQFIPQIPFKVDAAKQMVEMRADIRIRHLLCITNTSANDNVQAPTVTTSEKSKTAAEADHFNLKVYSATAAEGGAEKDEATTSF